MALEKQTTEFLEKSLGLKGIELEDISQLFERYMELSSQCSYFDDEEILFDIDNLKKELNEKLEDLVDGDPILVLEEIEMEG